MTGSRGAAYAEMTVCAVLWSTAGILIKMISLHPLIIAGGRSLIAAGIVALYLLEIKKAKILLTRRSALIGLCLSATFISFTIANKLTTASNAVVLQYNAPILVTLFSALFYHQKLRAIDLAAALLTFAGILMCFVKHLTTSSLAGDCIAVASGFFFAGMYLASGNCSTDEQTRMSGIFYGHILTSLIGLLSIPFLGKMEFEPVMMWYIAILGVFQLGIPYILYGAAANVCSPLACCLIGAIEPILNPVWVFLFYGENPGIYSIAGSLVVVCSVTLWAVYDRRIKAVTGKTA